MSVLDERYREYMGEMVSAQRMKQRMQEVVEANWGWFYRRGQVMGFSQEVGRWVAEVRQQVTIVGEIFLEIAPRG
jgi:hypothetical protein